MRCAFSEKARVVWLAAVIAWLGGCRPTAAADAALAPIEPSFEQLRDEHDGFWWTQMGEQSAAVVSFGPTLESPAGRFRPWSLVVFLPGGAEPLSCVQGMVELDGVTPIAAKGGAFSLELEPCAGCNWGQVTDDTQLVARSSGIY